jgi:NitT/TauT family transport system permease protein
MRKVLCAVWKRGAPPAVVCAVLVAVWQILVTVHWLPFFVPSIGQVISEIGINLGAYFSEALMTVTESLIGFALGNVIAFGLGVAITYSDWAEDAIYPYAVALKATPIVALAPLIVAVFGFGPTGKAVSAALVCFFPLLVQLPVALRRVPKDYLYLFQSFGADSRTTFWQLRLVYGSPQLFAVLKTSATLSVVGALVGELVNPSGGLGKLLVQAFGYTNGPQLVSAGLFCVGCGLILFLLVAIAERLFVTWKPEPA